VKILIPTPLRAYTGSKPSVDVHATTVQEALDGLVATHPEIKQHCSTQRASYGPL